MSSRIHPQARTTPKIRQEIKDSGLSSREAAKVFNITRATAKKWLGRDDVQDRSHRAHKLHTTLSEAQEAAVLALRQSLYLPLASPMLRNALPPNCASPANTCSTRAPALTMRRLRRSCVTESGLSLPPLRRMNKRQPASVSRVSRSPPT